MDPPRPTDAMDRARHARTRLRRHRRAHAIGLCARARRCSSTTCDRCRCSAPRAGGCGQLSTRSYAPWGGSPRPCSASSATSAWASLLDAARRRRAIPAPGRRQRGGVLRGASSSTCRSRSRRICAYCMSVDVSLARALAARAPARARRDRRVRARASARASSPRRSSSAFVGPSWRTRSSSRRCPTSSPRR